MLVGRSLETMGQGGVGVVFTPVEWAKWLLRRYGIFQMWCSGATVCDPTAGQGSFALALFELARDEKVDVTARMLENLALVEINKEFLKDFARRAEQEYGIALPVGNLLDRDVITRTPKRTFDILVGNPPWANFAELPQDYKEKLKPYFSKSGLTPNKQSLLLGASRVDIAALVLKTALGKMLNKGGIGVFYLPLSLFCGDVAHVGFRDYTAFNRPFCVNDVYEFCAGKSVFSAVTTSYCCASFQMDKKQTFPVRFVKKQGEREVAYEASPFSLPNDQWRIVSDSIATGKKGSCSYLLKGGQKPREGVNTCGANDVFVFKEKPDFLPADMVYPMVTGSLWSEEDKSPRKWIFLPYYKETGKPVPWDEMPQAARAYLLANKERLLLRKGTIINASMKRGLWWSLLGVGLYSFMPYKVIWQAYGKKDFSPIILGTHNGAIWQANQAMQAYIACQTAKEANELRQGLENLNITEILKETNSEGKCNWAQPGKIFKILQSMGVVKK